ncbi:MAG: cupin [marine bacterium B5-7]|nr:MAG: cupin [marine bacterium B5-7]
MPNTHNIFADLPAAALPNELIETLVKKNNVKIERIVSTGQTTPVGEWYAQDADEFVILLQGAAELTFEDEQTSRLNAGDYLHIPAHCKHRVSWTEPTEVCVWLAVHFS